MNRILKASAALLVCLGIAAAGWLLGRHWLSRAHSSQPVYGAIFVCAWGGQHELLA